MVQYEMFSSVSFFEKITFNHICLIIEIFLLDFDKRIERHSFYFLLLYCMYNFLPLKRSECNVKNTLWYISFSVAQTILFTALLFKQWTAMFYFIKNCTISYSKSFKFIEQFWAINNVWFWNSLYGGEYRWIFNSNGWSQLWREF